MRKGLGIFVAMVALFGIATSAPADEQPPNVVVIMLDDATVADVAFMPHVELDLAALGTTFSNSLVSFSLCCPSRTTYLTGRYAHNTGVGANHNGYGHFDPTYTLATWLHDAGYQTGFVGKYLNGYGKRDQLAIPPGWDDWRAALSSTESAVFDYDLSENGAVVHYGLDPSEYKGGVITQQALDFLRSAPTTQPFYLNVAYQVPHHGSPDYSGGACNHTAQPDAQDLGSHADLPLPEDPSFNEADVSDKPVAVASLPSLVPRAIAKITKRYRCRLDSLLSADRGVEQIVDELGAEGRLADTLILFTSDNGWMQGEHRIANGKVVPYEPSIRVPLIVRGPGFAEGATASARAANIDYAPTILRATGVAATGHDPDGVPLQDVAAASTPTATSPSKASSTPSARSAFKASGPRPTPTSSTRMASASCTTSPPTRTS